MRNVSRRYICHLRVNNILKIAIVFCQLLLASEALAVEADKRAHFTGGSVTGLAVDTLFYHVASGMGPATRIPTATALSLIPGLIVEILDELGPKTSFSCGDLLADGLGAITGVMAAELINGQLWISASGRQIRLIGHW